MNTSLVSTCLAIAIPPFPCDPKLIQSIGGEIVQSGHTLRQSLRCALFATSMGSRWQSQSLARVGRDCRHHDQKRSHNNAHCETEYCLRIKRAFPPVT